MSLGGTLPVDERGQTVSRVCLSIGRSGGELAQFLRRRGSLGGSPTIMMVIIMMIAALIESQRRLGVPRSHPQRQTDRQTETRLLRRIGKSIASRGR